MAEESLPSSGGSSADPVQKETNSSEQDMLKALGLNLLDKEEEQSAPIKAEGVLAQDIDSLSYQTKGSGGIKAPGGSMKSLDPSSSRSGLNKLDQAEKQVHKAGQYDLDLIGSGQDGPTRANQEQENKVRLILQFEEEDRTSIMKALEKIENTVVRHEFNELLTGVSVDIDPRRLEEIKRISGLKNLEVSRRIRPHMVTAWELFYYKSD